jgi:hypothetical protein
MGFNRVRKKTLVSAVSTACFLSLSPLVSLTAQAADWKPELLTPIKGGTQKPADAIRIALPKVPEEVIQRLALELDDFDVTGMVVREGSQAVFTPPQALAYGDHQLRLVEHLPDGNIVERGVWNFQVRKTSAFREAQLQAATNLIAGYRVADDDLPQPELRKSNYAGTAQLQGVLANGPWRTTGEMDLLYNSNKALMPRGVENGNVDMGRFLLTGEAGPVVAQAGHHTIGPDSLIMQGFNRRGVSLGLQSKSLASSITAFSQTTQDVIGFQEGLAIGNSENRTDGVSATVRPIPAYKDNLLISAQYLSGEGPSQSGAVGTGVAGDPTKTSGNAGAVIADTLFLDKRMRIRGEYAFSRFDFDGQGRDTDLNGTIDSNQPVEHDQAYQGLFTYTPWHNKVINNKPLAWNLGVENKKIGTYFKSPANPVGIADRESLRGFTGVNYSGVDVQVSIGRDTDNVNDIELLPQTETWQKVFVTTFVPQLNMQPGADGKMPELPWYGQPMLNLTWIDIDQDVEKSGAGLSTGALSATRTLSLNASFSYATWSYGLSHTIGQNDSTIAVDTKNRMTQLNANARIGEKLTVGPILQYNYIDESNPPSGLTAKNSTTKTLGLNAGYTFTQRINATMGYNVNSQDATDNSVNTKSADWTGSLNWIALPAQGNVPGLTLSLEGLYHDAEDLGNFATAAGNQNNYQIFLKAALGWMPSF